MRSDHTRRGGVPVSLRIAITLFLMTQVGYMYFDTSTYSLDGVIEWHILLVQVPVVIYQQYRVVASPVLREYHICRCQVHNENNLAQPHKYIP